MYMLHTEKIIYAEPEVAHIASLLARQLPACKIVTFEGPLGAGKTTLVRELLQQCGVTGEITSPTFTYMNVYKNNKGETFYHFDLYRIKTVDEFIAAGFDEYLYQPQSWVFIEWPSVIMPLLTHDACHISIDYANDLHKRMLTMRSE